MLATTTIDQAVVNRVEKLRQQNEPAVTIRVRLRAEFPRETASLSSDDIDQIGIEPAQAEQSEGIGLDPEPADELETFTTDADLIEFIEDERNNPSVYALRQFLTDYPAQRPISDNRLKELVRLHAPTISAANGGIVSSAKHEGRECQAPEPTPCPPELKSLVESGAAFYSDYNDKSRPDHWLVKKCSLCGNFNQDECCGKPTVLRMAESDGRLTKDGRQAAGLEPIAPPKTPEQKEQERIKSWEEQPWWKSFRGADELIGSGEVEFLIEGFLMKGGVTFFGGPPEGGKSLVAMSVAKALTTGNPLFGKLKVIESSPVLWLGAEGGDNGLKIRCNAFRMTMGKRRFICRTLSQGVMLKLTDQNIESLVRQMNPVVILETAVRFGDGDEDSAADANQLAGTIFQLISMGARAVVAIHHARKNVKDTGASLEAILRGSSDFGAMADVVIAFMRDEKLYQDGKGPNEIDLISCKGRDFTPPPIRLAVTEKAPEGTALADLWAPGLVSCINQNGDLKWVDKAARVLAAEATDQNFRDRLAQLVQDNPTMNAETLAEKTGAKVWMVKATLKTMGYTKASGRAKAGQPHQWSKQDSVEKIRLESVDIQL